MNAPATFADAEANLPAYESRPQQQAFAEAIEHALDDGHHLPAEAGTGCIGAAPSFRPLKVS